MNDAIEEKRGDKDKDDEDGFDFGFRDRDRDRDDNDGFGFRDRDDNDRFGFRDRDDNDGLGFRDRDGYRGGFRSIFFFLAISTSLLTAARLSSTEGLIPTKRTLTELAELEGRLSLPVVATRRNELFFNPVTFFIVVGLVRCIYLSSSERVAIKSNE
jgi:hypothetical protein